MHGWRRVPCQPKRRWRRMGRYLGHAASKARAARRALLCCIDCAPQARSPAVDAACSMPKSAPLLSTRPASLPGEHSVIRSKTDGPESLTTYIQGHAQAALSRLRCEGVGVIEHAARSRVSVSHDRRRRRTRAGCATSPSLRGRGHGFTAGTKPDTRTLGSGYPPHFSKMSLSHSHTFLVGEYIFHSIFTCVVTRGASFNHLVPVQQMVVVQIIFSLPDLRNHSLTLTHFSGGGIYLILISCGGHGGGRWRRLLTAVAGGRWRSLTVGLVALTVGLAVRVHSVEAVTRGTRIHQPSHHVCRHDSSVPHHCPFAVEGAPSTKVLRATARKKRRKSRERG